MNTRDAVKGRIARMRKKLREADFDAALLTSNESVRYLTGFTGEDSWMLLSKNTSVLITDGRYSEQAARQCSRCRIISRKSSIIKAFGEQIARCRSIKRIAVEASTPVGVFNRLQETVSCRLEPLEQITSDLRQYKTEYEIERVKKAASIAKSVLKDALTQITPDISESRLAGLIEFEMRKRAVVPAFETIAAFGANASRPHHSPGKRRLRRIDTILIDYGVKYDGYCCDITRCFTVGRQSRCYRFVYDTVLKAQKAAIAAAQNGKKISDADKAAREVIKNAQLPIFPHSTGHGVGLNVHESPAVYGKNDERFEKGQIVTIEPGVYIPGKLGIRIEDDILITENKPKILTKVPKNLQLLKV